MLLEYRSNKNASGSGFRESLGAAPYISVPRAREGHLSVVVDDDNLNFAS